ncbi:MAG: hypothetical protein ABMB14_12120 [Myxococcota bacterium]
MSFVLGATIASGHPPGSTDGTTLADDAYERLATEIVRGPPGCWVAEADTTWDHTSGGASARGAAAGTWRLEGRVWSVDRWAVARTEPDAPEVRVAPMLLGAAITAPLSYPTTMGWPWDRRVDWPSPVATLPARTFGEIDTVAIDLLGGERRRVVRSFAWDGWKKVSGELRVELDGAVPVSVAMEVTDRWPLGCAVRSVGAAEVDPRGLPVRETWTLHGACPLRDWDAVWTFAFRGWARCATGGG